jgi:DNA polymerase sigma
MTNGGINIKNDLMNNRCSLLNNNENPLNIHDLYCFIIIYNFMYHSNKKHKNNHEYILIQQKNCKQAMSLEWRDEYLNGHCVK